MVILKYILYVNHENMFTTLTDNACEKQLHVDYLGESQSKNPKFLYLIYK